MRILLLSWEYPPHLNGGLGQHVKELAPALAAAAPEVEVHIVTPTFDQETHDERIDRLYVHRVQVAKPADERIFDGVLPANQAFARATEQLLAAHGSFDLIHIHDWLPSFAGLELARLHDLPVVATIHATERGRYRGQLYSDMSRAIDAAETRLAQGAQRVITCSVAMQREVQTYYGVPRERIQVIPNGIDPTRLRGLRSEDLRAFRLQYAQPDELLIFNVGRLVYEKGADLLVETAPAVLSRVPTAKFVIGGRGPMAPSLDQRIASMHLQDKIVLTGYLSDEERDRLYVAADLCVFPSRYEPFGIVALEAMAAGTPVVVSDVGGLGTVVRHEETGLTAYAEDVNSLAWAITRALSDPAAAAARAQRAEVYLESHLAWPVIARSTLDVYAELRETGQQ